MVHQPSETYLPIGVHRGEYQLTRKAKADNIIAILKSQLGDLSSKSALDFGCHQGFMTIHLASAFHDTIGVDRESGLIAAARQLKTDSKLVFQTCTGNRLPFMDGVFDVIIANHVLYYVEDPRFTLCEFHRLMKDDSICFVSGINGHYTKLTSLLPERLRSWILRTFLKASLNTGNSISYDRYLSLFEDFDILDFSTAVMKNPETYARDSSGFHKFLLFLLSHIPQRLLKCLTRYSPTFLFILRKKNIHQQAEASR